MHADEVDTDVMLVRRLLATQFPRWADLAIEPIRSSGTDNAMYRLGDDMVVRMPRIGWAVGDVEKEHEWLPRLAPHLPLTIPVPIALGESGEGYPWRWSVNPWLDGETATIERISDPRQMATDLARFISALRGIDLRREPTPEPPISSRGGPLASRDASTRAAIAALEDLGMIDAEAVTAAWDADSDVPEWHGLPVWTHGDLQTGNLLAIDGQLSAVIDFGCLGVGDPACDLAVAWNTLTADTREVFRAAFANDIDDATWARGRGWALSVALIALPYYYVTNPVLAGISRYAIAEVLSDHQRDA